jgi:hypothetical protein
MRLLHLGTVVVTGFGRESDGNVVPVGQPLQQPVPVLTEDEVLSTLKGIKKRLIDIGEDGILHLGTQIVTEFGVADELNNVRPADTVSIAVFRLDEEAFREAYRKIAAKRDEIAEVVDG